MSEKKGATIFDFIDGITHKKKEWSKYSETDQKLFSPYIVNRWLSMRQEFCGIVNELQTYTIGLLRPSETYRLYHDLLPASKGFEIGSGFGGTLLSGYDHNDEFYVDDNGIYIIVLAIIFLL